MRCASFLAGALFLVAASVAASSLPSPSALALKSLHDAGKFDEALRLLQEQPSTSHDHFYNLGTLAYRLNRYGQAVAYLEKALELRPYDSDTRNNLQLARSALSQSIGASKVDPASTLLESFGDLLAPPAARAALSTVGLLLILIGAAQYRRERSLKSLFLHPAGTLALLGIALQILMVTARWIQRSHPAAFPIERQVVRSGPGDQFLELAQIEAGVKLRVLGESEAWLQVRYAESRVGWLRAAGVIRQE